jgi:hypothetical protein
LKPFLCIYVYQNKRKYSEQEGNDKEIMLLLNLSYSKILRLILIGVGYSWFNYVCFKKHLKEDRSKATINLMDHLERRLHKIIKLEEEWLHTHQKGRSLPVISPWGCRSKLDYDSTEQYKDPVSQVLFWNFIFIWDGLIF